MSFTLYSFVAINTIVPTCLLITLVIIIIVFRKTAHRDRWIGFFFGFILLITIFRFIHLFYMNQRFSWGSSQSYQMFEKVVAGDIVATFLLCLVFIVYAYTSHTTKYSHSLSRNLPWVIVVIFLITVMLSWGFGVYYIVDTKNN